MELFIFIAFQLLMEVQSYKAPAVKVSPDVLRESSSVKMICETPADVTVKQCYFYRNSEQKNIKVSPSCELDLTGAEVLRWADVKSPASVDIYCFYLITEHRIDKPSSHSPAATVTVLGLPQLAKLTASASVIKETDTVQLSYQYLVRRSEFICENNLLLHCEVTSSRTISSLRSSDNNNPDETSLQFSSKLNEGLLNRKLVYNGSTGQK
ncbi:unnamed protein product [Leuciscus chuanchicus]